VSLQNQNVWELFNQETQGEEIKHWSSDQKLEEAIQIKEGGFETELGARARGGNNSLVGGWRTSPYILGMILTPTCTPMFHHPSCYESDGET
jgi:hypothetical protein